jgi:hypothetical protein
MIIAVQEQLHPAGTRIPNAGQSHVSTTIARTSDYAAFSFPISHRILWGKKCKRRRNHSTQSLAVKLWHQAAIRTRIASNVDTSTTSPPLTAACHRDAWCTPAHSPGRRRTITPSVSPPGRGVGRQLREQLMPRAGTIIRTWRVTYVTSRAAWTRRPRQHEPVTAHFTPPSVARSATHDTLPPRRPQRLHGTAVPGVARGPPSRARTLERPIPSPAARGLSHPPTSLPSCLGVDSGA